MTSSVLITGTNRGIGLEFVRQYLHDGYKVYACCRTPEKALELLKLKQANFKQLEILPLDVQNQKQLQAVANSLQNDPIDVLINNAGVYGPYDTQLGNLDIDAWQSTLLINCIAPIKLIEALLPNISAGDQKKIISMTSKMGSMDDNHSGGSYIYRSSKAALNAAMKSVAVDTKSKGMIAVVLHPGWVKTDMGGPNAEISVTESVNSLKSIIDHLTLAQSGQFIDVDGSIIPW